jgi:hypothetical protein
MTDKDNNDPPKPNDSGNAPTPTSGLPSLKESLRTAVQATNRMLATVHDTVVQVREPVVSTWQQVADSTSVAVSHVANAYDRRHEYGPAAIAATTFTAGAVVTLRRGRLPGAVAAVLAGGLAYGVVYGLDDLPDFSNSGSTSSGRDKRD